MGHPAITPDHAQEIRRAVPVAAATLMADNPGYLDRFSVDINFPARRSDGGLEGRGTYQILFDRRLGGGDSSTPDEHGEVHDIANWLFCEWSADQIDGGDRFIIAAGTITKTNVVSVSLAGLGVIGDKPVVEFVTAGKITQDTDKKVKKLDDLSEQELVSFLASFRSSFVNGATIYSGDLEKTQ